MGTSAKAWPRRCAWLKPWFESEASRCPAQSAVDKRLDQRVRLDEEALDLDSESWLEPLGWWDEDEEGELTGQVVLALAVADHGEDDGRHLARMTKGGGGRGERRDFGQRRSVGELVGWLKRM